MPGVSRTFLAAAEPCAAPHGGPRPSPPAPGTPPVSDVASCLACRRHRPRRGHHCGVSLPSGAGSPVSGGASRTGRASPQCPVPGRHHLLQVAGTTLAVPEPEPQRTRAQIQMSRPSGNRSRALRAKAGTGAVRSVPAEAFAPPYSPSRSEAVRTPALRGRAAVLGDRGNRGRAPNLRTCPVVVPYRTVSTLASTAHMRAGMNCRTPVPAPDMAAELRKDSHTCDPQRKP